METDKELTLSIEFNEIPEIPNTTLTFPVRVAWCKHEAQSPYYNTGVEFVDLSDQNKKVIEAILEDINSARHRPPDTIVELVY